MKRRTPACAQIRREYEAHIGIAASLFVECTNTQVSNKAQAHISTQKKRSLSSSLPPTGNGSDNERLHAPTGCRWSKSMQQCCLFASDFQGLATHFEHIHARGQCGNADFGLSILHGSGGHHTACRIEKHGFVHRCARHTESAAI